MIVALDLLTLSDAFRKSNTQASVFETSMVAMAREVAVLSTHWEGEYGLRLAENKALLKQITGAIETLAITAASRGYKEIILPFAEESDFSQNLRAYGGVGFIAEQAKIRISFQAEKYYPDHNNVDPAKRTCLDEGLRGVTFSAAPWEQRP